MQSSAFSVPMLEDACDSPALPMTYLALFCRYHSSRGRQGCQPVKTTIDQPGQELGRKALCQIAQLQRACAADCMSSTKVFSRFLSSSSSWSASLSSMRPFTYLYALSQARVRENHSLYSTGQSLSSLYRSCQKSGKSKQLSPQKVLSCASAGCSKAQHSSRYGTQLGAPPIPACWAMSIMSGSFLLIQSSSFIIMRAMSGSNRTSSLSLDTKVPEDEIRPARVQCRSVTE